ncbi:hypothetical protein FOWG_09940 [Fusarium oxysporum f. sp. lycopersici MN25]|uniref:Uncharacterized protein n=1 Tax=Fusarium oxysporum Fo47 TaxID=660027 RepID=W9JAC0_FUSOX|nr:hypothetical protein FOZG_17497 [Fusarium oxysporum Fo47]EWZ86365.1 hypothetical protein FOWG_09940 [Fusarium oxysporum f. sp. lycopersici MN25]
MHYIVPRTLASSSMPALSLQYQKLLKGLSGIWSRNFNLGVESNPMLWRGTCFLDWYLQVRLRLCLNSHDYQTR